MKVLKNISRKLEKNFMKQKYFGLSEKIKKKLY